MDADKRSLITPVHARVRGRVRLRVSGLYRSQRLKQVLEAALVDVDGVRDVQANILTGRLLVIFTPAASLADITAQIESRLGSRRPRKSGGRSEPGRPRFRVSRVLDGFAALVREFSSARPRPVLGMTADGSVPSAAVSEKLQDILAWHSMPLDQLILHFGVAQQQGLGSDEV